MAIQATLPATLHWPMSGVWMQMAVESASEARRGNGWQQTSGNGGGKQGAVEAWCTTSATTEVTTSRQ